MTGRTFPAITLWQPWASLIFWGIKRHETRGFPLPKRLIGEWVAIHAAARSIRPAELGPALDAIMLDHWGSGYEVSLPHRAVLGLVRFAAPIRTEDANPAWTPEEDRDRSAGDWTPGRWAWPIVEHHQLDEPFPATGRQGWWKIALDVELAP